jgi:hypothetical protein
MAAPAVRPLLFLATASRSSIGPLIWPLPSTTMSQVGNLGGTQASFGGQRHD